MPGSLFCGQTQAPPASGPWLLSVTTPVVKEKHIICKREKASFAQDGKRAERKKEFQYKNAPKRDQNRETGQASDDQASSKPSSQISAQNHQTSSLQTAFSEVTSALLALLFVSWVEESVAA